jgi:hypothetical protein
VNFRSILAGALLGALAFFAVRLALARPEAPPHFHANFAVFVDGRRVDLTGGQYSEEVASCRLTGQALQPQERVHLHNRDPDVAHVHHAGVTWGHLFANLGFGLGGSYMATDQGSILADGAGKTLKFVVNGRLATSVHNVLIASGDRLLVSYGAENAAEVLAKQFPAVASDAPQFNERPDPAGCSGAVEPTFWDRLRHAAIG